MKDDVVKRGQILSYFYQIELNQFNNIIRTSKWKKNLSRIQKRFEPVSIKSDSFPTVDDPESRPRYYRLVEPTSLPSGSMCRLIRLRTGIVQNGIMGHDQDQAAESRQDAHLPMELLSYHPSVAPTKIFHREMNDKHNYPGYRRISSVTNPAFLVSKTPW